MAPLHTGGTAVPFTHLFGNTEVIAPVAAAKIHIRASWEMTGVKALVGRDVGVLEGELLGVLLGLFVYCEMGAAEYVNIGYDHI